MRINDLLKKLVYSSDEIFSGAGAGFLIDRFTTTTGLANITEYEVRTGREIRKLSVSQEYFHTSNPKIVPDTVLSRVPDKSPLGRRLERCLYPL